MYYKMFINIKLYIILDIIYIKIYVNIETNHNLLINNEI